MIFRFCLTKDIFCNMLHNIILQNHLMFPQWWQWPQWWPDSEAQKVKRISVCVVELDWRVISEFLELKKVKKEHFENKKLRSLVRAFWEKTNEKPTQPILSNTIYGNSRELKKYQILVHKMQSWQSLQYLMLLQYFCNTFTILLQYFYNTFTILLQYL